MTRIAALVFAALLLPRVGAPQIPAPQGTLVASPTPGVTRTLLKEDDRQMVSRVTFAPGAREKPHTHPFDVILVPTTPAAVDVNVAGNAITSWKPGDVEFVPRGTTHFVANTGSEPMQFVIIGIK